MPSQTVTVGSRVGLHARPAALIAEAVGKAGVPVTLATPGGDAGRRRVVADDHDPRRQAGRRGRRHQ